MLFKIKKQKIGSAIQYGTKGNGNIRTALAVGIFLYIMYILTLGA